MLCTGVTRSQQILDGLVVNFQETCFNGVLGIEKKFRTCKTSDDFEDYSVSKQQQTVPTVFAAVLWLFRTKLVLSKDRFLTI